MNPNDQPAPLLFPMPAQPAEPDRPPIPTDNIRWLRGITDPRQHAVYAEARGGYWFFCGRFGKYARVRPKTPEEAVRQCYCCKSRIRLQYLIPKSLRRIKDEEAAA